MRGLITIHLAERERICLCSNQPDPDDYILVYIRVNKRQQNCTPADDYNCKFLDNESACL